jgi:hypothetical protein
MITGDSLGWDVLLFVSALAAGAINSVAGGGTLLTFPALLSVVPSVVANATSTVALVPGSLAGAWGYRSELRGNGRWALLLAGPCVLGGVAGALLVTRLEERYFALVVPWLVLGATLLFLAQPTITRLSAGGPHPRPHGLVLGGVIGFQFLVAVYGGYFGAGIGILMLTSLSLLGFENIHQLNALKTFLAACINGVSVIVFVIDGKVDWRYTPLMAAAAIMGGYFGARGALRLNRNVVRWIVILIGFALSARLFWQPPTTPPPAAALEWDNPCAMADFKARRSWTLAYSTKPHQGAGGEQDSSSESR